QANQLAKNIIATLRGKKTKQYYHKYAGSVAGMGLYKGVADVYGVKATRFIAWFMHRSYHVTRMPTYNRKLRIIVDWTLALFFRSDTVPIGQIQHQCDAFERAAASGPGCAGQQVEQMSRVLVTARGLSYPRQRGCSPCRRLLFTSSDR